MLHRRSYNDAEVVEALGRRDRKMEEWFYHRASRYFDEHFNRVFFDRDRKQEVFQTAFLKLWTEIDNRRICVVDGTVCRQQKDGRRMPMTCSLTTFLMAFARTEYREIVRSTKEQTFDELMESAANADTMHTEFDIAEDADMLKSRIVDECIQTIPPSCVEILTLFYYEGKSLGEIMTLRSSKTTSKNGLKTAKNKCMNTLRQRIEEAFRRHGIQI